MNDIIKDSHLFLNFVHDKDLLISAMYKYFNYDELVRRNVDLQSKEVYREKILEILNRYCTGNSYDDVERFLRF